MENPTEGELFERWIANNYPNITTFIEKATGASYNSSEWKSFNRFVKMARNSRVIDSKTRAKIDTKLDSITVDEILRNARQYFPGIAGIAFVSEKETEYEYEDSELIKQLRAENERLITHAESMAIQLKELMEINKKLTEKVLNG